MDTETTGSTTLSQRLRDQLMILETWAADLHIREHGGQNEGAEVEAIIELATGKREHIPWCLAFQHAAYERACRNCGIEPRFDLGVSCSALVARMKKLGRSVDWQRAQRGDLWVLRGGDTGYRHVGAVGTRPVLTGGTLNFWSVEGNTNAAGSAEGDGVYRKSRHIEVAAAVFIDITS
jgi:hypothetical protein